jgi:ABC-type branched-subunit amino acid transport system permease subunit
MKLRYFIPLLFVSAVILMLLNVALMGVAAYWSSYFMKAEYGKGNLIIMRAFPVLASAVIGLLALPLAYVARTRGSIYGILLAILGLMLFINPWNQEALIMLRNGLQEYLVYVLSCWGFWRIGVLLRNRKKSQPSHPPDG